MKILFYEVQHFSQNFREFTGSKQYLPKKFFLAQLNSREKKMSESVSGYYKTKKKRKKVALTTKPLV